MGDLLGVPLDPDRSHLYAPIPAEENPGVAKCPFEDRAWLNGYGNPSNPRSTPPDTACVSGFTTRRALTRR